jgi:hypothetical protein
VLLGLLVGVAAIVLFAAAGPSLLVSRGGLPFPAWLSGPLHGLFGRLTGGRQTLEFGLSAVLVTMAVAYGVALVWSRWLSMRGGRGVRRGRARDPVVESAAGVVRPVQPRGLRSARGPFTTWTRTRTSSRASRMIRRSC